MSVVATWSAKVGDAIFVLCYWISLRRAICCFMYSFGEWD